MSMLSFIISETKKQHVYRTSSSNWLKDSTVRVRVRVGGWGGGQWIGGPGDGRRSLACYHWATCILLPQEMVECMQKSTANTETDYWMNLANQLAMVLAEITASLIFRILLFTGTMDLTIPQWSRLCFDSQIIEGNHRFIFQRLLWHLLPSLIQW